jgi:hypothetical protein
MPVDTLTVSVRIRHDYDVCACYFRMADRRASFRLNPGGSPVKVLPAYTASIVEGGFLVTL